jgi:hypothetical protein
MLADILEYRLLVKRSQSEPLTGRLDARRQQLASRLAAQPGDGTRRFARIPVSWPGGVLSSGDLQPMRVVDIGAGGIAVDSDQPLPEGELDLIVSVNRSVYRLFGRVCWRRGRTNGLAFPELP